MNANAAYSDLVAKSGLPLPAFIPLSARSARALGPTPTRGHDPAIEGRYELFCLVPFVPRDEKPM